MLLEAATETSAREDCHEVFSVCISSNKRIALKMHLCNIMTHWCSHLLCLTTCTKETQYVFVGPDRWDLREPTNNYEMSFSCFRYFVLIYSSEWFIARILIFTLNLRSNSSRTLFNMMQLISEDAQILARSSLGVSVPPSPISVSRLPDTSRGRSYCCPRIVWSAIKSQGSEITNPI